MEVTFAPDVDDLYALAELQRQRSRSMKMDHLWSWGIVLFITSLFFIAPERMLAVIIDVFSFAFVLVGLYAWNARRLRAQIASGENTAGLFIARTLLLGDEGLTERSEVRESTYRWRAFSKVTRTPQRLFVELNRLQSLVIPRRAFASDEQYEQWGAALSERVVKP
jgi:hypothetical protein